MRMLTSLTAVVLVGLSVGALAANVTITQKGRLFSSESITIKKGESLARAVMPKLRAPPPMRKSRSTATPWSRR